MLNCFFAGSSNFHTLVSALNWLLAVAVFLPEKYHQSSCATVGRTANKWVSQNIPSKHWFSKSDTVDRKLSSLKITSNILFLLCFFKVELKVKMCF